MDQEKAKALFRDGGFLLIEGMPKGTEFGIDWKTWTTGEDFEGIKMIPPGVHFVHYNSVCKQGGGVSPKTGFFHNFVKQEIVAYKWDPNNEMLVQKNLGVEEVNNVKLNLQNMDRSLAAYPYDMYRKWVSMSSSITPNLVCKLSPLSKFITSSDSSLMSVSSNDPKEKFGKTDANGLPVMKADPSLKIRFTKIPSQWYPSDCTPWEKTIHSMDSSYVLGKIIEKNYEASHEILGELQYAFICFVLGQVMDGFEHWRSIVKVLCSCGNDMNKHKELFKKLIAALYHQINEISPDFFVDIVSSNNFLVANLTTLFESIAECEDSEMIDISSKFKKHLKKKYKWKFNKEPEDCLPIVVET